VLGHASPWLATQHETVFKLLTNQKLHPDQGAEGVRVEGHHTGVPGVFPGGSRRNEHTERAKRGRDPPRRRADWKRSHALEQNQ
jgi:hypothetical protein